MRIATLQFAPSLGAVEDNIQHANTLLESLRPGQLELLVLPELAFSGYNFPSLTAIKPYLELTTSGPSTQWAIATAERLKCHVIVGYPESSTTQDDNTTLTNKTPTTTRNYNSAVTVSPTGQILHNYRKSFLYYTDETWACDYMATATGASADKPADNTHLSPFFCGILGDLGLVGQGICMDINPYRFTAPWHAYEFANAMLNQKAKLVVLSMAWLTRLLPAELGIDSERPDMETVAYWLERFHPLIETRSLDEVIVVFANRCGIEGDKTGSVHGENEDEDVEKGDRVCYAGSSCVMRFQGGSVRMFEKGAGEVAVLGKGEEGVLLVDTEKVCASTTPMTMARNMY